MLNEVPGTARARAATDVDAMFLSYGTKRSTLIGRITSFFRAHKAMTATTAVIAVLLTIWWHSPAIRGSFSARIDIARGHYEIQTFGFPSPTRPQYVQLLRNRYGVQCNTVAGCVVSGELISYVEGYNSVVYDETVRRFGHDIFAECAADARKAYEKSMRSKSSRQAEEGS